MSADHLPLVSIVVPSYNQGRFIEDTLLSILGQDYPNIEVLVFDGGSTDETLLVLERYKEWIQYVSEQDGGQSNAINKGFRAANGDIVAWLNSDDIYLFTDTISNAVAAFTYAPDVDILYGDYIRIDEDNRLLKVYRMWRRYDFRRLMRFCYISQPTVFFRKTVTDRYLVDESLHYGMDIEFWLRLGQAGLRFKHVRRMVAAERIHASAKTVARPDRSNEEALRLRATYLEATGSMPVLTYTLGDRLGMIWYRIYAVGAIFQLLHSRRLVRPLKFESLLATVVRNFNPNLRLLFGLSG